jgi:thioesterase domain-containing protein
MGGVLALEVQRLLRERGAECPAVLVDPWVGAEGAVEPDQRTLELSFIRDVLQGGAGLGRAELEELLADHSLPHVLALLAQRQGSPQIGDEATVLFEEFRRNTLALLRHRPPMRRLDAEVWVASNQSADDFPHLRPLHTACAVPERRDLASDHYTIMEGAHLARIVASIRAHLDPAGRRG